MRQRTEDDAFFVRKHNFEIFAVPPANCWLFYARVPVCWSEIESMWLASAPSPPYLAYYSSVLFHDVDCITR